MFSPYEKRVVMPVMTLCVPSVWASSRRLALGAWTTYDDGEGHAKVVRQPPIPLQFLLVAKLRQTVLVAFLRVRRPPLNRGVFQGHLETRRIQQILGRWRATNTTSDIVCTGKELQHYLALPGWEYKWGLCHTRGGDLDALPLEISTSWVTCAMIFPWLSAPSTEWPSQRQQILITSQRGCGVLARGIRRSSLASWHVIR